MLYTGTQSAILRLLQLVVLTERHRNTILKPFFLSKQVERIAAMYSVLE